MTVNIGIEQDQRQAVAQVLSGLLADTYTLYLKTHNYHWNVTGPLFATLHGMFEGQYTELATAVDEIAERIRALGEPAPGSYGQFAKLTILDDAEGTPTAEEMIGALLADHEKTARRIRQTFSEVDEASDEVSADLLTQRLQWHEQTAWMLRSLLA